MSDDSPKPEATGEPVPGTAPVARAAARMRAFGRRTLNGLTRFVLLIIVPLVVGAIGLEMYTSASSTISTENAYVRADKVSVSSDLAGRVVSVSIRTHDRVDRGDVLFTLDARAHEIELAEREAELLLVRHDVLGFQTAWSIESKELAMAEKDLAYFEREYTRQSGLAKGGLVSRVKIDGAEHDAQMARQRINASQAKLANAATRLGGDPDMPVENHPRYLQALARRDAAALDVERSVIRAPVSGIVSNVDLQPGEYVEDGKPVFSIIEDREMWVTANLKETELTHIRLGHHARVEVDAYPDRAYEAVVDSISPATGAEFSLLPPQNASGNWVKVVQRVPVRLALVGQEARTDLRVGMSVTVSIDTGVERALPAPLARVVAFVRKHQERVPFLGGPAVVTEAHAATSTVATSPATGG